MSARLLCCATLAIAFALGAAGAAGGGAVAAPIRIGVLSDCEGIWATSYEYTLAGAELALIERGAKPNGSTPTRGVSGASVAGRPIRLFFGCADNTAASALSEARRLVEQVGVDILIGPLNGNEELALQEYARTKPSIAFVNGSSSVQLADPAPNFFSFHTDGAQWDAGLGAYAYRRLGWRTAVTVTKEDDVFYWDQAAAFVAEFCSLGGRVTGRVAVPAGATDFSTVNARLARSHADGIFFATGSDVVVAAAHADPALQGNLAKKVLTNITGLDSIGVLGKRIDGMILPDRNGPGYFRAGRPYKRAFEKAFPRLDPAQLFVFDSDYYAGMKATLRALGAAHGDLSNGERRLLAALGRVQLDLPNGHVRLNARHQAIAPNYLFQLTRPDFTHQRLIRTMPAVEPTFGGYFTAHDALPSATTPVCRAGHVPRWAHG